MDRIRLRIRDAIALGLGTTAGVVALGCHPRDEGVRADAAPSSSTASTATAVATSAPSPRGPDPLAPPADVSVTFQASGPGRATQCRTGAGATASAVGTPRDSNLDCPKTIVTNDSIRPAPRGDLDEEETHRRRAQPGARKDECCYAITGAFGNRGRPLLDDGRTVLADIERERGYAGAELPEEAERWLAAARAEHASIASFARSIIELMSVGAPLDLLEASQQALAQEIDHARACLRLAEQHAGISLSFGPLPALAPRGGGLRRVALDVFEEGCASETISAVIAARALETCRRDELRPILARIAEDEASHAALAWRTLAWALMTDGGDALRAELRGRAAELRDEACLHHDEGAVRSAWEWVIEPSLLELSRCLDAHPQGHHAAVGREGRSMIRSDEEERCASMTPAREREHGGEA
jgi:hypothetical protein